MIQPNVPQWQQITVLFVIHDYSHSHVRGKHKELAETNIMMETITSGWAGVQTVLQSRVKSVYTITCESRSCMQVPVGRAPAPLHDVDLNVTRRAPTDIHPAVAQQCSGPNIVDCDKVTERSQGNGTPHGL